MTRATAKAIVAMRYGHWKEQHIDLRGLDVSGQDIAMAHLAGADLTGTNFAGCELWEALLEGATLIGANLLGADLRDADFNKANLTGVRVHLLQLIQVKNLEHAIGAEELLRAALEHGYVLMKDRPRA